jgi:dienelactone hydrolase
MLWRLAWFLLVVVGCRSTERSHELKVDQKPPVVDPWDTRATRATSEAPDALRASDKDYAESRLAFRTKLVVEGPSPQPWEPVKVASDAREIAYESDGRQLRAWVSPDSKKQRPAVLFLHGGFAFALDDWAMTKAFRDAGYVVMMPILRGENGLPGSFSLFYNEVDDVLAALKVLEQRADVDQDRIFITGHSAGGTIAMLAALASPRFRAAATLSGSPDVTTLATRPGLQVFDPSNVEELRMRSAVVFAKSFKCPARLYFGAEEDWAKASTEETARRAQAGGLDVQAMVVPGDHFTMLNAAIPAAIEFFDKQP